MIRKEAWIEDSDRGACESLLRLSGGDFTRLSRFIHDACGIKMPPSKKVMLEARLQKRLRSLGMRSFAEYCTYLFSGEGGEGEVSQMVDLVTTNKTDFFREPDHFAYLLREVLPAWVRQREGRRAGKFRAWSAGCATGEEPYTLAMVLHEFAATVPGFDFHILASDISTRALETARLAIYPEERTAPVPVHLKRKYFLRSRDRRDSLVRIVPCLREKVGFQRLNLMADDFGIREEMDIIFCRNVIIYFDRPTQTRLLLKFCRHLAAGGHVFLGHSETLEGLDVRLKGVYPTVYRKGQ